MFFTKTRQLLSILSGDLRYHTIPITHCLPTGGFVRQFTLHSPILV